MSRSGPGHQGPPPRFGRWRLALVLAASMIADAAPAVAQDPPRRADNRPGARAKAPRARPARRKPKGNSGVGLIVPYPFPPALIIRQTPEAHDEVQHLLDLLRYQ